MRFCRFLINKNLKWKWRRIRRADRAIRKIMTWTRKCTLARNAVKMPNVSFSGFICEMSLRVTCCRGYKHVTLIVTMQAFARQSLRYISHTFTCLETVIRLIKKLGAPTSWGDPPILPYKNRTAILTTNYEIFNFTFFRKKGLKHLQSAYILKN